MKTKLLLLCFFATMSQMHAANSGGIDFRHLAIRTDINNSINAMEKAEDYLYRQLKDAKSRDERYKIQRSLTKLQHLMTTNVIDLKKLLLGDNPENHLIDAHIIANSALIAAEALKYLPKDATK
ncbi:hypothetical protein EBR77_02925 [bacterium]|nr:hypothetical protein [bacterium]